MQAIQTENTSHVDEENKSKIDEKDVTCAMMIHRTSSVVSSHNDMMFYGDLKTR